MSGNKITIIHELFYLHNQESGWFFISLFTKVNANLFTMVYNKTLCGTSSIRTCTISVKQMPVM